MDKWVVRSMRGIRGTPNDVDEYLVAIRYDPYQKGGDHVTHTTSEYQADAFKFRTLAGAEVAAVYVGGRVVKLTRKAKP